MRAFDLAVADGDAGAGFDVEAAFGEHAIIYWVPRENRLVPASPQEIASFESAARLDRAAWRMRRWRALAERARHARRRERRRVALLRWASAPARGVAALVVWALRRFAASEAPVERDMLAPDDAQARLEVERKPTIRGR